MNERPDPEALRELGESSTNVANSWAGAEEYLSQGLVTWTRRQVADDQRAAVTAAIMACRQVIDRYPTDGADAHAPKQYVDDLIAKIQRWIENPSNTNKEAVRSTLDTTRQLHAWQGHQRSSHFWTLEAVDHASLSVWAGESSSYIVPLEFAACAARAVACVLHAQLLGGVTENAAIEQLTGIVLGATAPRSD
jgi:hypothetical protein